MEEMNEEIMDVKQEVVFQEDENLGIKQQESGPFPLSKKCGEIYMEEHESFMIVCVHCNILFSDYNEFINHLKLGHENIIKSNNKSTHEENKLYSSNFVEVATNKNVKLEIVQNEEQIQENVNIDPVAIKDIKKRIRTFSCRICKTKFKNKKTLNEHKEISHSKINENEKSEENSQNITTCIDKQNNDGQVLYVNEEECLDSVKKKRIRRFPCEICKIIFKTKKSFREHEETEHKHKKIKTDLSRNLSESDDEDPVPFEIKKMRQIRKYPCQICNKNFKTKKAFLEHIELFHDKESDIKNGTEDGKKEAENKDVIFQPYKCDRCTEAFTSRILLDAHIRWHNGEVLPCRVCGKEFYINANRLRHEVIHGEKKLLCTICGNKFKHRESLRIHMIRHEGRKPHKCLHCEMSFASSSELREHRRKHTGEKPFECDICHARFTIKKSLRTHKKLHSDKAEYKCNICGKSYKQFAGLYTHKKHHR